MRSLYGTRREAEASAQDMTELFFKALFKLGVYVADWDVLYGTRPSRFPIYQKRAREFANPSNPNAGR